MSIDLSPQGGVAMASKTERGNTGPLLVATDGSKSSDAAFPAAMLLADHMQAAVEVLSVVEPLPLIPEYPVSAPTSYLTQELVEPFLRRATEQVKSLGTADWPVDVEPGHPIAVISREAKDRKAQLIIVGLNHHDTLDRLLSGETMVGLVRRSQVPVLAVSPSFQRLPRRVVIAVDFSRASKATMRAALMILEEPATVYLVHVKVATDGPLSETELVAREYELALPEAFEQITAGVDIPAGIRIERVTLRGNVSRTILEFAESVDADLLVAGSHGRGAIRRLIVGSVATRLLRETPCSILIVPRAAEAYLAGEPTEVVPDSAMLPVTSDWAPRLSAFTRRNAARRVVLEIDDPEIGSQAEATDYPFLGADFDHQTGRVEIMLGDPELGGRHLTHSVSGVTSIDVLADSSNRDTILRLAHGSGQTLLTFI